MQLFLEIFFFSGSGCQKKKEKSLVSFKSTIDSFELYYNHYFQNFWLRNTHVTYQQIKNQNT